MSPAVRRAWLVVCLVAGCSHLSPPPAPEDFLVGADSGVVIGSVTSPVFSEGSLQLVHWVFRSSSDPAVRGILPSAALFNPYAVFASTTRCDADGLGDLCGRLFAIELPAGDYAFHTVSIAGLPNVGWEHPQLRGFNFAVVPGTVTYIGNLDTWICWGAVDQSNNGVLGAVGQVTDQFNRDWPLLARKFPGLADAKVEQRLVSGDTWRWALGMREGRTPPAGWGACAE